jgi:hypothetical protein
VIYVPPTKLPPKAGGADDPAQKEMADCPRQA